MPIVAYESELEKIDFTKVALNIGIVVPGQHRQWMEFSAEELKVLALLISRPIVGKDSAASEYPMLRMLGAWAEAAGAKAAELERLSQPQTPEQPPVR